MMDQAQICKGRDIKKKEDIRRQKIVILGDSHARGVAQELQYQLNQEFEVQSIIKPRATMRTVVSTMNSDINKLTKRDVCIIWAGTQDIGKNETEKGSEH
jgi:precorrin-4 methylase